MYVILFFHTFYLPFVIFHVFPGASRFSFFDISSIISLIFLIHHSRIFFPNYRWSAHLQFFISRSVAYSFPGVCVFLNRYSLTLLSVSSFLFLFYFLLSRFLSLFDSQSTFSQSHCCTRMYFSLCPLFHMLSSKICYREADGKLILSASQFLYFF